MGTQCLPYFLLARVLRLILSLELLHLRLCLPAGMPRRLRAWARGGETGCCCFFLYLAQEISRTQTATVGRNLSEPAVLFQHPTLLLGRLGNWFLLILHLCTVKRVNKETGTAAQHFTNFTWDENQKWKGRVALGSV